MASPATTWGTTPAERLERFPCDRHLDRPQGVAFRGIDVGAPPPVVFRRLCQLRVAPYSYDLLDNLGRRSPRELTPGLDELEVGQRFMTIFDLVEFEQDRQLTLLTRRGAGFFGEVAVTYLVRASGEGSRLLVKLAYRRRGPRPLARLYAAVLPWGDLVMMRKQLRTLAALAERDAVSESASRSAKG